jgi:hypothetical protein
MTRYECIPVLSAAGVILASQMAWTTLGDDNDDDDDNERQGTEPFLLNNSLH